jgi:hypothetical protein
MLVPAHAMNERLGSGDNKWGAGVREAFARKGDREG